MNKRSVIVRTPVPTLEEFRVAIGLSKKRAKKIEKRAEGHPVPWTDKDLDRRFRYYNRKYFAGKLSVLYVRFRDLSRHQAIGHTASFRTLYGPGKENRRDSYAVEIDHSLKVKRSLCDGTLLHEMVHVELNLAGLANECHKGTSMACQRFQHRMLKLAEAGAMKGIW